ncbi:type II secretion system F family protein [Desulfothermobacter acidiphilus]|uniref:type II secretion system F family protein n=1 Tax=Desulfothermobacter acidiphilus TaxID=1938353 RepID=UPI003F89D5BC
MPDMTLIGSLLLFLALFSLAWYWERRRLEAARLLERGLMDEEEEKELLSRPKLAPWRESLQKGIKTLLELFQFTSRWRSDVEKKLVQANLAFRAEEYILLAFFFALAGAYLGFVTTGAVLAALIGALLMGYVPFLVLQRLLQGRLLRFQRQLPDALNLMANAVRSGFGLFQAMDVVRREMPPPVSQEFGIALMENSLGMDAEEVLRRLCQRVPSEELDLAVTAIVIQRQVGGNLGEILQSIASTVRERLRVADEVRVLTAQGRLSATIIGLLPVALFVFLYLTNQDYLAPLFTQASGRWLLALALTGELVGALMLRRIVEVVF